MLLIFGNDDAIVDSASLFVVMYRLGRIGVPAAAEMKTNDGTFCALASCASAIASHQEISSLSLSSTAYIRL